MNRTRSCRARRVSLEQAGVPPKELLATLSVSAQRRALDGDPVHQPPMPGIIIERIVPGAAVVPEGDRARVPLNPA
jgi:hypothetical protein